MGRRGVTDERGVQEKGGQDPLTPPLDTPMHLITVDTSGFKSVETIFIRFSYYHMLCM